jgi:hypothetical protein
MVVWPLLQFFLLLAVSRRYVTWTRRRSMQGSHPHTIQTTQSARQNQLRELRARGLLQWNRGVGNCRHIGNQTRGFDPMEWTRAQPPRTARLRGFLAYRLAHRLARLGISLSAWHLGNLDEREGECRPNHAPVTYPIPYTHPS